VKERYGFSDLSDGVINDRRRLRSEGSILSSPEGEADAFCGFTAGIAACQ